MPPNGMISSARPPIHRSTLLRPPSDAAGVGAGGVEEVDVRIGRNRQDRRPTDAGDEGQRGVALAFDRRLAGDQRMRAVGGDEVDDRRFVLEMAGEIDPALIGLEQDVLVGRLVERRAGRRSATARRCRGRAPG